MGLGITNMGELIIVTLLAGGMLEMIRYNGGIDWIILKLTSRHSFHQRSRREYCRTNQALQIFATRQTIPSFDHGRPNSQRYCRSSLKSIRDAVPVCWTFFSCFVQGIIPYGAQLLMAAGLGHVSPIEIMQYLYYPYLLGVGALLAITFNYPRKYAGDC